jgi:undecaprenyl-diphosphatase
MSTSLQAALLGVVQGLTEFLPVSSTAHLILARAFFGWDADQFGLAFDVACHVGTLVAVVAFFWPEVVRMIGSVPNLFPLRAAEGRQNSAAAEVRDPVTDRVDSAEYARLIWLLAVGTVPAVAVGLVFGRVIEDRLRTVPMAAFMLAAVALGLFWAERAGAKTRGERSITFLEAFWIGCAQAVALIPGVSRSGATLIVALFIGLRRQDAARFIFLLSIPAILGAAAREAPKILRAGLGGGGEVFVIGVVSSAIVGYIAVKYFIRYVADHSLDVFAWYRLALAACAVVWLW